MNTRLTHMVSARGLGIVMVLVAAMAMPSLAQDKNSGTEPGPLLEPASKDAAPPAKEEASVSEAEQHFRTGVDLYNRNLYLDALNEFNRALTLDPQLEKAKTFRDKSNAKLQMSAIGGEASGPTFDAVSPESIPNNTETSQLSAEEMKIKRVAELLKQGDKLIEAQRFRRAVKVYEQVLLIAPDNNRARQGFHDASLGAAKESIKETDKKVEEDRIRTEKYVEESKTLPKGADETGIKPYRIQLPIAQEEFVAPVEKGPIEKILDAPVSIEFENIHLSEIIEFISDSYDVNIVPDDRVIMKPPKQAAAPAAPAAPTGPAMPGPFPQPNSTSPAPPGPRPFAAPAAAGAGQAGARGRGAAETFVTDGMINYINLKNVTLREALKALLRPLNLDYSVQPGFIWISTPERIRLESFEELQTKYYELRNAGAETLFKVVLRNPGGGGGMMGGGMGGYGGGRYGGGMGGMGGNMMGGMGGMGGNMMGGMGGMGGGMGGYGGGGMMGGGMMGGGMMGGGGMGGYGGGGMMGGGGMGGMGGMGGGMGGGIQIQNISQLFGSINDRMVGETPAIIGTAGLSTGGTGAMGGARLGGGGGGMGGAGGAAGLGGRAQGMSEDEPEVVRLLRMLIDDVYEPNNNEPVSRMIYVPHNNQLIVHNTPTNLAKLEKELAQLDVTPKQVSIEAKFLTIKTSDLNKIGFTWSMAKSDQGNRAREIPTLQNTTYNYDINGDGVTEPVPFYNRPNGSSVIRNTISTALMDAVASPGPKGAFSLSGIITDNADGDKLNVVMDYMNQLDESELLSAPRVTTMNRKPAVIADLTTEYYVSQVETDIITTQGTLGGSGQLGFSQQVIPAPFNFGITLSVTPQISGGDQVRLWLNPQVTTKGLEKTFTQKQVIEGQEIDNSITLPNTSTQAVWTNVIVHDGDTLVLGGLVSDQTVKSKHKMPYLADIPVVGFFFRGKSKQVDQSSLLIFVTPTIIDTTGARFFEAGTGPSPARKSVTPLATVSSGNPAAAPTEATPITSSEAGTEGEAKAGPSPKKTGAEEKAAPAGAKKRVKRAGPTSGKARDKAKPKDKDAEMPAPADS